MNTKRNILMQCVAFAAMLFLTLPAIGQSSGEGDNTSSRATETTTGVQIGGAVYGGGRCADVTGNSYVAVINAERVNAVYGGNDIAGAVSGEDGSHIWIGNDDDNASFSGADTWKASGTTASRLEVGDVYGGGNGYYLYPGITTTDNPNGYVAAGNTTFNIASGNEALYYRAYDENGTPTDVLEEGNMMVKDGYVVPTINTTNIVVASQHAFIDSVFGGAKNAFVGEAEVADATTRPTSANIDIKNGTIYSLFGGNNYGGVITNLIDIAVEDTYKVTDGPVSQIGNLTSANLGVTHGIKYLFGGGNRVAAPHVKVRVSGGQIDTAFAGGNSATVAEVTFEMNAGDGTWNAAKSGISSVTAATSYNTATGINKDGLIYGTRIGDYGYIRRFDGVLEEHLGIPTMRDYQFNARGGYMKASGEYVKAPEDNTNVYNIRTLFGGNNRADMYCVPTLTLTSGGIGTLYGGGNAGDMKGLKTLASPNGDNDTLVSTYLLLQGTDLYVDYVYAGCQMANVDYGTYVRVGNSYAGHIFGGCNISGDVGSYRTIEKQYPVYDLNGNLVQNQKQTLEHAASTWVIIDYGARVFGNVFGGANGYYHCNEGKYYVTGKDFNGTDHDKYVGKKIPTVNITHVIVRGGHVYEDIYGGGNLAYVGYPTGYTFVSDQDITEDESNVDYHTADGEEEPPIQDGISQIQITSSEVTVNGLPVLSQPFVLGDVYGGGNMASVFGVTDLLINGRPIINGAVYGGNDKTGHVERNDDGSISTTVHGSTSDGNVVASDGTLLNRANASTYVLVQGTPLIGAVFGGGNGNYDYDDNTGIGGMLCNANDKPVQPSAFVDINVSKDAFIGEVYGGGNNVTVLDSVTVLINAYAAADDTEAPSAAMVGSVYGGCNQATMEIVPYIVLQQGRVNYVYGGGNAGDMKGLKTLVKDGVTYTGLGTYVYVNSRTMHVDKAIYGGCTQSDVSGSTLVLIDGGKVESVLGGNNVSGHIGGNTQVVVNDGMVTQVYGGSNGYYTYMPTVTSDGTYYTIVYPFGTTKAENGTITLPDGTQLLPIPANAESREGYVKDKNGNVIPGAYPEDYISGHGSLPNVGTAVVKLHGGTIYNNIYGGGYAATCDNTLVHIEGTAILPGAAPGAAPGAIFGGGRGDSQHLGFCEDSYPHLGAVTKKATVELVSCDPTSEIGRVYGGGDAGDAANTLVKLYPTFEHDFDYMYAGCKAGNVSDTATMLLDGIVKEGHVIADTIYGGNDIAGHVAHTHLVVNSGNYGAAFGGGNGDYNYKNYYAELHGVDAVAENSGNCFDSIPSTGEVIFTINDKSASGFDNTTFSGYVYGGGNMALVGDRTIGQERWSGNTFNPAAFVSMDKTIGEQTTVADAKYGRIELNIHGGYFAKRVFTGARGKAMYAGNLRPFFGLNGNNTVATAADETGSATEGSTSSTEGLQLVYGLKQVNMDGGRIMLSLHGGSEFINDGYPYECKDVDHTTMRPSSIVNVVGGSVIKSVYGGGFEGTIYGSVYVNIGKEAVENSEVWSRTYSSANSSNPRVSFTPYKPNTFTDALASEEVSGGTATADDNSGTTTTITYGGRENDLARNDLYLQASVFAGSDWGDAGKKAVFDTRGVYGGETNILIDGNGYLTHNADASTDGTNANPDHMLVAQSIIGAGTSTEGGDISRKVQLFNYGKNRCFATDGTLQSIQRADTVILDHAYITLDGTQDAYSAYPSQNYSIARVRNLILRDDNHLVLNSPAILIDTVESMKRITTSENTSETVNEDFAVYNGTYAYSTIGENEVTSQNSICAVPTGNDCGILSDEDHNRNVLLINNGSYLSVQGATVSGENQGYGPVIGYCYLASGDGLEINVFARSKTDASNAVTLNNGFWSLCDGNNQHYLEGNNNNVEADYENASSNGSPLHYRVWRLGSRSEGRSRAVTIVAHQNPDADTPNPNSWLIDDDDRTPNGTWIDANGDSHSNYAIATASIDLPPANAGSYYHIKNIIVDAENAGEVALINAAWDSTEMTWRTVKSAIDGRTIEENPSYKFGLLASINGTGNHFAGCEDPVNYPVTPQGTSDPVCETEMVIAGTNRIANTPGNYFTPKVAEGSQGVINKLNFALTYNTQFERTLIRTVTFVLDEYIPTTAADDTTTYTVSPVYITVDIATIIEEFGIFSTKALAMYNEGIEHEYQRKVVLPAAREQRHLYLTGVKWAPSSESCAERMYSLIAADKGLAGEYTDANGIVHSTAKITNDVFSVVMRPGEDVSTNSTTAGWYSVAGEGSTPTTFDVRALYDAKMGENATPDIKLATNVQTSESTNGYTLLGSNTAAKPNDETALATWIQNGEFVGILDGRATAALYLSSFYNGTLVYGDCDNLGSVTLQFGYVNPQGAAPGTFEVTLQQWSRESADTIYVASSKYQPEVVTENGTTPASGGVQRTGNTANSPIWLKGYHEELRLADADNTRHAYITANKGKEPQLYLNSFTEALQPGVYVEGDVIAIIDEMVFGGDSNIIIHGSDENNNEYANVQVIRYSGSHYQLPGEHGAYRGPMITLSENAQLGLFNVWLNGSGFTRTKGADINGTPPTGEYQAAQSFGDNTYYKYSKWVKDTLFVENPMVVVKGNATFTAASNVKLSNAISRLNSTSTTDPTHLGAAITLVDDAANGTPHVVLGDNTNIFNNAMIDHSSADNHNPGNIGAAVHVHSGVLQMGGDGEGHKVLAHQNYFLNTKIVNDANATTASISEGDYVRTVEATNAKEGTYEYYTFSDNKLMWNNVSLVRTPTTTAPDGFNGILADYKEMNDAVSSHIVLKNSLSADSKVGVSKWFPGGAPSYDKQLRDTIGFAKAPTSPEAARLAHANGNFFADSLVFGIDTFYHNLVDPYTVYFHRCASFKFNPANDIYYAADFTQTCPGTGYDALKVNLQEGFLPYTYTWHSYKTKLVTETTIDGTTIPAHYEIDDATKEEMRTRITEATIAHEKENANHDLVLQARHDSLPLTNINMPGGVDVDRYYYTVTVTDLTGCEVQNNAMIKFVKAQATQPKVDNTNYLGRSLPEEDMVYWIHEDESVNDDLDNQRLAHVKTETSPYYTVNAGSEALDSNFYHYRPVAGRKLRYKKDGNYTTTPAFMPGDITDTNKYLRFFNSYLATTRVSPSYTYGTIYRKNDEGRWVAIGGMDSPYEATYTEQGQVPENRMKVLLCPGDELELTTLSTRDGNGPINEFVGWSFDATTPEAIFTMPDVDVDIIAYYGPKDYWYQVQSEHPGTASYEVDYHGNVHIKDSRGLAWFISTVNGLNYQQAQTFYYDTIYLERDEFDMSAHRWTPLGNIAHPFRGTVLPGENIEAVHIRGIYCDEFELPYVGLFGVLDGATIGYVEPGAEGASTTGRIKISDSRFTGYNDVGTLAAKAVNGTKIYNVDIANISLQGENALGGMLGSSEESVLKFNHIGIVKGAPENVVYPNNELGTVISQIGNDDAKVYYYGASVYLGGLVGVSKDDTIMNNAVQPHDAYYARPLYAGGIAGKAESSTIPTPSFWQRLFGAKSSSAATSQIVNNYVNLRTSDDSYRVGGLVGEASNVSLRNNYAYGNLNAKSYGTAASLVAIAGDNVEIEHCFYNDAMGSSDGVGLAYSTPTVSDTSAFSGTGKQVTAATPVDGLDNVTVLLNKYVREQGNGELATWRSAEKNENAGLPVFGSPDTIPVYTYLYEAACDSFAWNGTTYTEGGVYRSSSFNPVLMIDSITTMLLTLNHSTAIAVSDSVLLGDDYNANGFRLTYADIVELLGGDTLSEVQLLQLTDSLLTVHGCDSVVSMTLVVYKNSDVSIDEPNGDGNATVNIFDVQVYPNPTTGMITVESEGLQQVEIFDNVSRKVMQSNATGSKHQMNLSRLSAGAYYVRVTTDKGVAVKKVIKK